MRFLGQRLNQGFTLVEVMVALVITMLAVAILTGGVAVALQVGHDTARWDKAVSRAESRLAAVVDPSQMLGERHGDDGGGYQWHTQVAFVTAVPAPRPERGGQWARGTGFYTVSVTISWRDGRKERAFVLRSARLGPVPGASP